MRDVIIIGGSFAGLSAALQLGRTRRNVLVIDAGQRRNRFASHSHGFLGQDGQSPAAIVAKGRAEVAAYSTVTWREASVTEVAATAGGFVVRSGSEEESTKRIILATGVVDQHPPIAGFAERWGSTVFHCPYCHGYELDRGALGVLATGPLAAHHAMLVSEWTTPGGLTLFLDSAFEPSAEELAALTAKEIRIEREPIERLAGEAPEVEVVLRGGRVTSLRGLFVVPQTKIAGPFAEQLGCALEDGPLGRYYKVDATKETSVPGVFACGDAAVAAGGVSTAVADGTVAATGAHRSLVFRA